MRQKPFVLIPAKNSLRPFLCSAPHVGEVIPEGIRDEFLPEFHFSQVDTDHLVHRVHEHLTETGITFLHGIYSRYVIDLNRGVDSAPLYEDGRQQTGICPVVTFQGKNIYVNNPPTIDMNFRRLFYDGYHLEIKKQLQELKKTFSKIVLLDLHSIDRHVPSIQKKAFPDIMIGDNNAKDPTLAHAFIKNFEDAGYSVSYNDPFKGGFITRHYASQGVATIQIEMSKDVYLESIFKIAPTKAEHLKKTMLTCLDEVQKLL